MSVMELDEACGALNTDFIRQFTVNAEVVDGVLKIDGSQFDDTVTVEIVEQNFDLPTVFGPYFRGPEIQVSGGGTSIWSADVDDVDSIEFLGNEGNDSFENLTSLPVVADGGSGDDVLIGGSGDDVLDGGDGDDVLEGRDGNDLLNGNGGDDEIDGGDGSDEIHGGKGADILSGGNQDDAIFGDDGDDTLHGDAGDDALYGGGSHDVLYGDSGDDSLNGMKGDDGLFGGDGKDTLEGGAQDDRLLYQDDDTLLDFDSTYDARIKFENDSGALVYNSPTSEWVTYDAGTWTEEQIEQVDQGLAVLHSLLGNTTFLKQEHNADVTFYRIGSPQNASQTGPAAWNIYSGEVHLSDLVFDGTTSEVAETVIHEMAHNWDLWDNPDWSAWKEFSGWNWTGTSHSGSSEEFESSYGESYAWEDWAEMFTFYVQFNTDTSFATQNASLLDATSSDYNDVFAAKFEFIDDWVSTL